MDPHVDAEVVIDRLRARVDDEPVRLAATAHYERARGAVTLAGTTRERSVGTLEAHWRGDAAELAAAGANGKSPIELDLDAELLDFPLHAIPALADQQIRGPLSGKVRLTGLGRNAKLEVSLDGSKATIGEVRMERLVVDVRRRSGQRARARGGRRSAWQGGARPQNGGHLGRSSRADCSETGRCTVWSRRGSASKR